MASSTTMAQAVEAAQAMVWEPAGVIEAVADRALARNGRGLRPPDLVVGVANVSWDVYNRCELGARVDLVGHGADDALGGVDAGACDPG